MLIHLMQHGTCLSKELDQNQPLSPVGREQVIKTAQAARILGLRFELVIASPKLRSMQTAEIMAEHTGYPASHIEVTDAVKAMTPATEAIKFITEYDGLDSILIAGHLPSLGSIASAILLSGKSLNLAIENGGLMQLDFTPEAGNGTLNWFLTPTQLGVIAGS